MKWAVLVCLATPIAIMVGSGRAAVWLRCDRQPEQPRRSHGLSRSYTPYSSPAATTGRRLRALTPTRSSSTLTHGFVMLFVRFSPSSVP